MMHPHSVHHLSPCLTGDMPSTAPTPAPTHLPKTPLEPCAFAPWTACAKISNQMCLQNPPSFIFALTQPQGLLTDARWFGLVFLQASWACLHARSCTAYAKRDTAL
jgi:hypothetical protein